MQNIILVELTIAILMLDLCFCQKYTLTSRLGGGDPGVDVRSTFRIEFSICE